MNKNTTSLSIIFKGIMDDFLFLDNISFLLFEFDLRVDFKSIQLADIIKNLDQQKIEKKGLSEKIVSKALFDHIITTNHIFSTNLRDQFILKLYKIKRKESVFYINPIGDLHFIHNSCVKSNDEIINWGYANLRYKYTSFYKENLDLNKFKDYLRLCNLYSLNKFTISRYFNSLENYLKYSYKSFRNYNSRKSVWQVRKK